MSPETLAIDRSRQRSLLIFPKRLTCRLLVKLGCAAVHREASAAAHTTQTG